MSDDENMGGFIRATDPVKEGVQQMMNNPSTLASFESRCLLRRFELSLLQTVGYPVLTQDCP